MFDFLQGVNFLNGLRKLVFSEENKNVLQHVGWMKGLLDDIFTGNMPPKMPADKELTKCLLPASETVEIIVDKGNQQAMSKGKDGLSTYLQYASGSIFKMYEHLNPGRIKISTEGLSSDTLVYGTDHLLLMGGPIANEGTLILGGYEKQHFIDAAGEIRHFPKFKPKNGMALGFDCGDDAYGVRDGKYQSSFRYENFVEREGAIFRVYDARKKEHTDCETSEFEGRQFISCEGLIITKIPNPSGIDKNRSIVIIGGVHGFSSQAFARDLHTNLVMLNQKTQGMKYYQVFVPCKVTHDHVNRFSVGNLEWEHPKTKSLEISVNEL